MGRVNVSNSFYWVVGKDSSNPIAGQQQDIAPPSSPPSSLSYDRDWIRFRASFLWASGDDDPKDGNANGFDGILDNPNFAGGEFSFWQRQQIQLFNVGLTGRNSLFPDLVSNKFQGQPNFVNPGLLLFNLGMDFEITPKLRLVTNANYLEFDETSVLERFTFQDDLDKSIGVDLKRGDRIPAVPQRQRDPPGRLCLPPPRPRIRGAVWHDGPDRDRQRGQRRRRHAPSGVRNSF